MEPMKTDMAAKTAPSAPMLEFQVAAGEVDAPVEVGEHGVLRIPVEVVAKSKDGVTFRKRGKCEADSPFGPETASDMRSRLLEDQED